jgi:hypothetical protein
MPGPRSLENTNPFRLLDSSDKQGFPWGGGKPYDLSLWVMASSLGFLDPRGDLLALPCWRLVLGEGLVRFVSRLRVQVGLCVMLGLAAGIAVPGVAVAASGAWWRVGVSSTPTVLQPGSEARIVVLAADIGDAPVAGGGGSPVRVSVVLPSWIVPSAVEGVAGPTEYFRRKPVGGLLGGLACPEEAEVLAEPRELSCTFSEGLPAFGTLEMIVTGRVSASAPVSGSGVASVEGGETPAVSVPHTFVTGPSTPFGVERAELTPENEGGSLDLQAGSHPFQLTTTIGLNDKVEAGILRPTGPELAKDIVVKLPPGLVGDANAIPQCNDVQFTSLSEGAFNQCPADSAVGVGLVTLNEPAHLFYSTDPLPIFNLTPERGEPARFGFDVEGSPVVLNTSVRTGSDYGVTVSASSISQLASIVGSTLVFWGVPGDARHAVSRGSACIAGKINVLFYNEPEEACNSGESSPTALLTLPASCSGSLQAVVEMDSWEHPETPGEFRSHATTNVTGSSGQMLGLTGCNRLAFDPSVSVAPDRKTASTPSGFAVDVHVPQEQALTPEGDAPADVKEITVAFPAGVQVNPAAANGLAACSLEQIGLDSPAEPSCPETSKVATAEVVSPLLNHVLKGSVYVAEQSQNPFGSLLALYLVVKDPISGVLLKLAGRVSPDPVTGQVTVTFENLPQLPFEDATISTFDSPRSAFSTPSVCGSGYETQASLAPSTGEAAVDASSLFAIEAGVGGSACASPEPFAPGFRAGTSNVQAGGYSPLVTNITRPDGDQALKQVAIQLPPGLEADIASVALCPEPEASQGACPASSLIGHTTVEGGLGNEPVTVEGGDVFLTGPYNGAPFGLSIVTDAKAGPFDLGNVVVRGAVSVDPNTAAVSVTTGAIPTILQGIPLQIKAIKVDIDRPGFTFDPTNCSAQKITGTITSAGAPAVSAPVSSAFQVANCAILAFNPKFSFSTTAKYSKKLGASLHVKVAFPKAPFGSQANIEKVKVDLPVQLPTRQENFKYACPATTFAANPADCSVHSIVGHASAITPILPVPVAGNAYLVSHAGESLPDLVMVLQGYGVTVDLTGTTHIKKGITSNTFAQVPDVPVTSFELTLPQGKYSLLAGYGNFCNTKLKSPVAFTAQNGLEIHETNTVNVTGCPKAKPKGIKASATSKTSTAKKVTQ